MFICAVALLTCAATKIAGKIKAKSPLLKDKSRLFVAEIVILW
jgi:hypothetical protein